MFCWKRKRNHSVVVGIHPSFLDPNRTNAPQESWAPFKFQDLIKQSDKLLIIAFTIDE